MPILFSASQNQILPDLVRIMAHGADGDDALQCSTKKATRTALAGSRLAALAWRERDRHGSHRRRARDLDRGRAATGR